MKKRDGFQKLEEFDKAKKEFIDSIDFLETRCLCRIEEANERVLGSSVVSPKSIPSYDKSAMDGYAVKASDTHGASASSPVFLDLEREIGKNGAKKVHTGSAIPKSSDAVVKIEDVEKTNDKLEVFKAVSPGENVDFVGEDIEEGDVVFEKNHRLRPFDIGFLRSLGIDGVEVYEKPRVFVVPTGDEVVPKEEEPGPGEVIESNSVVIRLICEKHGAEVTTSGIIRDNPKEISESLKKGVGYDLIVLSGGTSVGERDHTAEVIQERGEVFSHGIAIRPGKPTLLGEYKKTPIVCLPGHPVACTISCYLFVKPALLKMRRKSVFERNTSAFLDRKIESKVGYRTFTRVRLEGDKAIPVRTSGSGIQTSLTSADGLVIIDEEKEGFEEGEEVEVILLE